MEHGFRDSEIARYSHETERRSSGGVQPLQPPRRDAGDAHRLLRAPPAARDMQLSELAQTWLNAFPQDQRPAALCEHYPRVANRIALCWPDAALTLRLIKSLLIDDRERRKGFPAPVQGELLGLMALAESAVRQGRAPSQGR